MAVKKRHAPSISKTESSLPVGMTTPIKSLLRPVLLITIGLTGCSSIHQKEHFMSSAGFRTLVPSTPAELAQLKTLPQNKVIPVKKNGKNYFLFADASNKSLMIGNQSQFSTYRRYVRHHKIHEDKVSATTYNTDAQFHMRKSSIKGVGVEKNIPHGPSWIKKALEEADENAISALKFPPGNSPSETHKNEKNEPLVLADALSYLYFTTSRFGLNNQSDVEKLIKPSTTSFSQYDDVVKLADLFSRLHYLGNDAKVSDEYIIIQCRKSKEDYKKRTGCYPNGIANLEMVANELRLAAHVHSQVNIN